MCFLFNHSNRNKDIIRALNRILNSHCVQKETRKMPKLLLVLLIKNCFILVSNRQNGKSVRERKIILGVWNAQKFIPYKNLVIYSSLHVISVYETFHTFGMRINLHSILQDLVLLSLFHNTYICIFFRLMCLSIPDFKYTTIHT